MHDVVCRLDDRDDERSPYRKSRMPYSKVSAGRPQGMDNSPTAVGTENLSKYRQQQTRWASPDVLAPTMSRPLAFHPSRLPRRVASMGFRLPRRRAADTRLPRRLIPTATRLPRALASTTSRRVPSPGHTLNPQGYFLGCRNGLSVLFSFDTNRSMIMGWHSSQSFRRQVAPFCK